MRNRLFLVLIVIFFTQCNALNENSNNTSYSEKPIQLNDVLQYLKSNSTDTSKLNSFWDSLKTEKQIPFTFGDSALFLYKGDATSVSWQSDFTGWGGDKTVNSTGTRITNTNIFYLKASFPSDSRIDYKIVVGQNWILDPNNPHQQWSGFGPNSELRMPDYEPSPYTELQSGTQAGSLKNYTTIVSSNLNYSLRYRVWTPANYTTNQATPYKVLFVTDGDEYADQRLGALPQVAANLIQEAKIEPIVIVFVSPINPTNTGQNRRESEYVLNDKYSKFLVNELIPTIERDYNVSKNASDRGILGTSLGGLESAYILATQNESFGRIGIQSPAFWYRTQIFDSVSATTKAPFKLFMSAGTISDTEEKADQMKTLFDSKSWPNKYVKVNEGHSWGNWRGVMDEALIELFPQMTTSISH